MKPIFLLILFITLTSAQLDFEKRFKEFQDKFKKNYSGLLNMTEKARTNFMNKLKTIEDHNNKFARGEVSFKMDSYEFDDEDPLETIAKLCQTQMPSVLIPSFFQYSANTSRPGPAEVDFRSLLMPVVNQKVAANHENLYFKIFIP